MTFMTLKRYVVIRTLVVAFALLWMGWLYFSRPEVLADAGGGKSSCHPVAWRYQGLKNEEEYYRRAEENIERSCEIARSDRRMFINVAAVVSVGLFLAVPKPKRAERSERNDSESGPNDSGNAENSGNAETGGA